MRRSIGFHFAFCILHSAFVLISGCNLVGAVAAKTLGNTRVKPEYTFPPQEPVLVLCESYGRANDLQPAADELANELAEELKEHKVATLVDGERLLALRGDHAGEFAHMKIPDVGRALGATQVLYVDLRQCDVNGIPGANVINGKVEANVRVVDVATGQTKWPSTGEGQTVRADTNYVRNEARQTPLAVRNQMLEELAFSIGRLFYEYEPEYDTGRGLEPQ
jgi:hypothetical protein